MTAPIVDLDALDAAAKAAWSKGPWEAVIGITPILGTEYGQYIKGLGTYSAHGVSGMHPGDARYIAAANPAVILELVRRLRAAEQEVNRLAGVEKLLDSVNESDLHYQEETVRLRAALSEAATNLAQIEAVTRGAGLTATADAVRSYRHEIRDALLAPHSPGASVVLSRETLEDIRAKLESIQRYSNDGVARNGARECLGELDK